MHLFSVRAKLVARLECDLAALAHPALVRRLAATCGVSQCSVFRDSLTHRQHDVVQRSVVARLFTVACLHGAYADIASRRVLTQHIIH